MDYVTNEVVIMQETQVSDAKVLENYSAALKVLKEREENENA